LIDGYQKQRQRHRQVIRIPRGHLGQGWPGSVLGQCPLDGGGQHGMIQHHRAFPGQGRLRQRQEPPHGCQVRRPGETDAYPDLVDDSVLEIYCGTVSPWHGGSTPGR
jgi:hypothetical protein